MNVISKKFNELSTYELYEILKARSKIFIIEQDINYQDMDDIDYESLHCFIMKDNNIIAYLRAFYKNEDKKIVKIGRVLTIEHGRGIGRTLLEQSLKQIKEKMNCTKICCNSQKHAIGFYEKFGFEVCSSEFLEEGILHVKMENWRV